MSLTRALTPLFFASLTTLGACGDDEVKPGSLVVSWTHGPTATCGTRSVTNLEARLLKGSEEVASASAPCETDTRGGTIAIPNVAPGTYKLEVEAFETSGKGTYLGSIARQNLSEGKSVDSAVVVLAQKPGRIVVDWTVPGGKCSSSSIKEVEVVLIYDAGTTSDIKATQRVGCDAIFEDPKTGADTAGVLFEDLAPNGDVVIVGYGYDSAKKKIAQGSSEAFAITPGDELAPVLSLDTCPGEPASCD